MAASGAPGPMSAGRRGPAPGAGRSPGHRTSPMVEGMEMERYEGDVPDTSHMQFVDGRCSCCPYGYHIDLDFLKYLDSMKDGSYLKNLKKIHRSKKKLRKSMEVFLQQQERAQLDSPSAPPPDVVHSSENFMNMVDYDEAATTKILDDIDSSVNATLSSIDYLMQPGKTQPSHSSTSYDDEPDSSRSPSAGSNRYRTEADILLSQQRRGNLLGKSDSISSLESQSTYNSEAPNTMTTYQHINGSDVKTTTKTTTTYHTFVTSQDMEDKMNEMLPPNAQPASSPRLSDPGQEVVTPSTLAAIREQMAISLQRMRELEEQVKAIPVLQVRISVLKEEKRLLGLQLQAKNRKLNMRSIGVGDSRIDEPDPLWGSPSPFRSPSPTGRSFEYNYSSQRSTRVKGEPPAVPPKPKAASRSIGVGDGNVFENYQLEAVQNGAPPGGSRFHEKELHSEQSTHIHEKEIKTVFLGGSQLDAIDGKMAAMKKREPPKTPPKPKIRHIGVGDGNVFDTSSSMHVHEKEVRTVYIGDAEKNKKATRNVGILCKAAMRDVGVTYMNDHAPRTRNIAIGAGEIGVGDLEGQLGIMEEGGEGHTSQSIINQLTSMQQLNMAAFHTKHIHIKNEHIRAILDEMFKKSLHSVGVQCRFATEDKGVNHVGFDKVDVGCGDKDMTIDVKVKPVVAMKSVAVENRPSMFSRSSATDRQYTSDVGTNTQNQTIQVNRAVNTDKKVTYPAATNTEATAKHNISTDTDIKIFQALDQVKNTGVNTPRPRMVDLAVNTETVKVLGEQNFDMNITFANRTMNTEKDTKRTFDRGVNTQPVRQYDKGSNTQKVMKWDKASVTDKPRVHIASTNTDPGLLTTSEGGNTEYQSSGSSSQTEITSSRVSPGLSRTVETEYTSPGRSSRVVTETVRTSRIGGGRGESSSSSREDVSQKARTKALSLGLGDGPVLDKPNVQVESRTETSPSGRTMTYETRTESRSGSRPVVTSSYETTPRSPISEQSGFSESVETVRTSDIPGYRSSYEVTRRSPGGSTRREIRTTREVTRSGNEPRSVVSSYELTPKSPTLSSRSEVHTTTRTMRSSPESGRTVEITRSSRSPETSSSITRETVTSRSGSASSSGSGGDVTAQFEQSPTGGTQMRVMRHVETTFVGDQPVKQSVEWTGSDGDFRQEEGQMESSTSSSSASDGESRTVSVMQDSGINIPRDDSHDSGLSGVSRRMVVTETRVDGRAGPSQLKSIMKHEGSASPAKQKKEITFSEDTVGGYMSTSSSEAEEDQYVEEEVEGSGSEGSQSSVSYDEGSYDGRLGQIVYTCKDDEAIDQGDPGASMYDQNIRETFELNEDMQTACEIYAQWLEDSTQVNTKTLNSSLNVIQQEWFKISSHKDSNPPQVEDFLNCFHDMSRDLLQHVVNMADANGNTALHYSVSHCNMEVCNLLMDTGACDINKQNKAGYTAIMLASLAQITSDRQRDVIQRMFEMGDVNAKASQAGQTALMLAVSHGRLDMVKMLLGSGADVNIQDEDGSTALMCASEHGHLEIVKELLSHPDSDPTLTDNDGSTALSIAMEAGHRDIGVLLYAHVNFKHSSPVMSRTKIKRKITTGLTSPSLKPRVSLPFGDERALGKPVVVPITADPVKTSPKPPIKPKPKVDKVSESAVNSSKESADANTTKCEERSEEASEKKEEKTASDLKKDVGVLAKSEKKLSSEFRVVSSSENQSYIKKEITTTTTVTQTKMTSVVQESNLKSDSSESTTDTDAALGAAAAPEEQSKVTAEGSSVPEEVMSATSGAETLRGESVFNPAPPCVLRMESPTDASFTLPPQPTISLPRDEDVATRKPKTKKLETFID